MNIAARLVNSTHFQRFIIAVILVNAVILGLLTLDLSPGTRSLLLLIDQACLAIFVAELALKLVVFRRDFFRDGWNIFDFIVVGIAVMPDAGGLGVLRTLRVLRLMRLISVVPSMRRVITGMFLAIPGGASVAAVLAILYYVGAIIGFSFFHQSVPEHFGSIGTTFFTLFKMMTLEGWPDIAGQVMEQHPHAWIFFVAFIILTTFTTLNLLFGIIVDAMQNAKEEDVREQMAEHGIPPDEESPEMRLVMMERDIREIRALLESMALPGQRTAAE
ncbi:ion transporter [Seohaeicola zhoushanensis]|uniref:Ion transport domain-containing protein n=1 Tax=Seohaeicola zhoushanensis TaxID=1569283 RepID=A0A8J3GU12_9RHOB|nr:ion transporter [Seohaeicola zhoushanensis]GHF33692.1 hypothetical protein GCM10017056_01380 [Seohaeicola zhoushanensis]